MFEYKTYSKGMGFVSSFANAMRHRVKVLINTKVIFSIFITLFVVSDCYAMSFRLPKDGSNMVGSITTGIVKEGENFSDVAERYDVGYYELFEANPGVDPDDPPPNTALIIPTKYILPQEMQSGIVLVNLAEMRIYYQPKQEDKVYIFPVGIGKIDWVTPVGVLKITEKVANPKWVAPDSVYKYRQSIGDPVERVIMPGPENPMGKYKLRLSNPTYLIHGTNDPAAVGRRASAGCIRLYSQDIEQLFNMVKVGAKVSIINQPYKLGWDNSSIYIEAHMPLSEQRLKPGYNAYLQIQQLVNVSVISKKYTIDWKEVYRVIHEHLSLPRRVGHVA